MKLPLFALLRRLETIDFIVIVSASLCSFMLVFQAIRCAPTSDEFAHLFASAATVRTGKAGFYRVNPPLHLLPTGIAIEALSPPAMDVIYDPSSLRSGDRREFSFGESMMRSNSAHYERLFIIGRLARIPWVIAGGLALAFAVPLSLSWVGKIGAMFWFTSPLVLGHGWVIMPDALSGVASILLILGSAKWLEQRSWMTFGVVGVCWGVCLGTKFTFASYYLAWPMVLGLAASYRFNFADWTRDVGCHFLHGWIALLVLFCLYRFQEIGVPLGEHSFRARTFCQLIGMPSVAEQNSDDTVTPWMARLPSPLPAQYLIGLDEQIQDLEAGIPTYVLGAWYPDGVWWYYFVGFFIKEQIAFWVAILLLIALSASNGCGKVRDKNWISSKSFDPDSPPRRPVEKHRLGVICISTIVVLMTTLIINSKMALNVRYIFPALPAIYLLLALALELGTDGFPGAKLGIPIVLITISLFEAACVAPHYFAYANMVAGGSWSVPPLLHDSNLDGGQDLWELERWLESHPANSNVRRLHCIHTAVPASALKFELELPSARDIQNVIRAKRNASVPGVSRADAGTSDPIVEIIVMKGTLVPAPWTRTVGTFGSDLQFELRRLNEIKPDEYLTPTLVVYRYSPK